MRVYRQIRALTHMTCHAILAYHAFRWKCYFLSKHHTFSFPILLKDIFVLWTRHHHYECTVSSARPTVSYSQRSGTSVCQQKYYFLIRRVFMYYKFIFLYILISCFVECTCVLLRSVNAMNPCVRPYVPNNAHFCDWSFGCKL